MDLNDNLTQDFLEVIQKAEELNQKITNYCIDFQYNSPNIKNVIEKENIVEFYISRYENNKEINSIEKFDKNSFKPIEISEYEKRYLECQN